jgi:acetyl esterase/lipase
MMGAMDRQRFLKTLGGGAMAAMTPRSLRAQTGAPETVVYKVAQGCDIKADVYRTGEGTRRPALLWIHGGALILGSRKSTGGPFHSDLLNKGYVIVSIDYRLAPETKLPSIIEDLRDAYRWMRTQGGKRFGIDPGRIAAGGGSAGGYLTLMTGFCVDPRPRALVSYYGYGDIDGPWYAEPDDFYRKQPLVPKDEALAAVGKTVVSEPPEHNARERFYLYSRQQGIWPNEVAGHDPHKEPKWFDAYCPVRNVTKAYPPTLLIHGTADTDVPYAESKAMAAKLAEVGVAHEFITVPGAGHGLAGATPEEKNNAGERAAEWVKSHMG